jgi:hypothetical protein
MPDPKAKISDMLQAPRLAHHHHPRRVNRLPGR